MKKGRRQGKGEKSRRMKWDRIGKQEMEREGRSERKRETWKEWEVGSRKMGKERRGRKGKKNVEEN